MKKLKIFLLLCLLVCLGFVLSSEVHAESNSPKSFEVGDVLPAGYVKISWDFTNILLPELGDGNSFMIMGIGNDSGIDIEITQYESPYYGYYREMRIEYGTGYGDNIEEEFILDTPSYTILSLVEPVTIEYIDDEDEDYYIFIHDGLKWEVVPPEYLIDYDDLYDGEILEIEEGTILPASIIGINLVFNNTGGSKSGTVVFTFSEPDYEYGQIILTAQEDDLGRRVTTAKIIYQQNPSPRGWDIYTIDDTLADQSFGSTRGTLFAGILLDFSWLLPEARTITDITIEGDLEMDVIFTRILTEEELVYQEGYANGYTTARGIYGWKYGDDWYNGIDAWYLGEKYARELYGYYDSSTDEWLSVSEYLERYGTGNGTTPTDPTCPTDFYTNFDKYFIPAMIIVFGGAIIITVLKVFKGRE